MFCQVRKVSACIKKRVWGDPDLYLKKRARNLGTAYRESLDCSKLIKLEM